MPAMPNSSKYSSEPKNKTKYTASMDKFYTISAGIYDFLVKATPVWKNWISQVIPHINGPRVLEVSFGTGYLLGQYAGQFETYGIEYNNKMVKIAKGNLRHLNKSSFLCQGNVESLPYPDNFFDTIINTMAFTGYPDARKALSELRRVLKPGGRLVMVDIAYPKDDNWLGVRATRFWAAFGDLIRDMDVLFSEFNFEAIDHEIGGFGSVHLYIALKR
jgi:ubiquinone/menaquinone biosynthesis C-methylase UbiE